MNIRLDYNPMQLNEDKLEKEEDQKQIQTNAFDLSEHPKDLLLNESPVKARENPLFPFKAIITNNQGNI